MPNAYASKICAGKIKDPSGKKRKDWGPKKAKKGLHVQEYNGPLIKDNLDGQEVSNKSSVAYYKGMIDV